MTLNEIDEMIIALENSSPTFKNCDKLASLYICREHFAKRHKKPKSENTEQD